MKPLEKRIYEVELTLTPENDPLLQGLTERLRVEVSGTGWQRLGQLLLKSSNFDQAEELY